MLGVLALQLCTLVLALVLPVLVYVSLVSTSELLIPKTIVGFLSGSKGLEA
jgi:hypothetical protein